MTQVRFGSWEIDTILETEVEADVFRVRQTHGGKVTVVGDDSPADGLLTDLGKQPVGVSTADCMPLVVTSPTKALALHVSRKSIIRGLLESAANHIAPTEITGVYIGPHICGEHFLFEFEGDDIKTFREKFPSAATETDQGLSLTLREAVQTYFSEWGVGDEIIHEDGRCTQENNDLPSYKRSLDTDTKLQSHLVTVVREAR